MHVVIDIFMAAMLLALVVAVGVLAVIETLRWLKERKR